MRFLVGWFRRTAFVGRRERPRRGRKSLRKMPTAMTIAARQIRGNHGGPEQRRKTTDLVCLQARTGKRAAARCRGRGTVPQQENAQDISLRFQPGAGTQLGRERRPLVCRMASELGDRGGGKDGKRRLCAATNMGGNAREVFIPVPVRSAAQEPDEAVPELGRQGREAADLRADAAVVCTRASFDPSHLGNPQIPQGARNEP